MSNTPAPLIRTLLWQPEHLLAVKARLAAQDADLLPAYQKLLRDAEKALTLPPVSVMDKPMLPPSGNRHDYYSIGPYWWPNPNTADGLPYLRRDGEVNPARDHYDAPQRSQMENRVMTLALAYFYSGDERYAQQASHLLRVWFLDTTTRMTPHLEYSQCVPGIDGSRGVGIIETRAFPRLLDAVGLLAGSRAWSGADQSALAAWFQAYLQWLLTSPSGLAEAAAPNNHGTWYDVQVAAIALFLEQRQIAQTVLTISAPHRLQSQIAADGSQPRELARTRSFSYSLLNLTAMMDLADLAGQLQLDLWHLGDSHGAYLHRAVAYLVTHAIDQAWSQPQITATTAADLRLILQRAVTVYHDERFTQAIKQLSTPNLATDRSHLL